MTKKFAHPRPDTKKILEHISHSVFTTDLDGVVTYWNSACERIFGYSSREMLNQSLNKIYPAVAKDQFKDDLGLFKKGRKIEEQRKYITKDGSSLWVDVHANPVIDKKGLPQTIVFSVNNIQNLKQVEEKLKENKAHVQAVLGTTVNGIITIDEDGKILSFNQAASDIFGYREQEVVEKDVSILLPELHHNRNNENIVKSSQSDSKRIIGYKREFNGKRKDGLIFPMELSISEAKWNGKKIFTCVVNDISERRGLEQEILRISEEERHRLGQDLHDGLGQMLTGISLISKNLARKLKSNGITGADQVQEISDLIKEADEYAKALAHGLIHIDLEDEGFRVALEQLCRRAEKLFNISCILSFDPDVKIDNNMKVMNLYRISQEAISNAVKHGKANNIHLSLTNENKSVRLTIEDDGIGFEKSQKDNKKKGMGIRIMKYRASIMSGTLQIFETKENKTNIICSIPNTDS